MPMSAQQDRIDRYVVEVGNGMRAEHDAMVDEMVEVIAQQVDHLDDGQTHATLRASVEGNVESIIHMLRNQVPAEQAQATASALAYALRLAQREISADSLRRAYHLGTEVVRRRYFEQVLALDASAEDKLHVSLQVQLFLHGHGGQPVFQPQGLVLQAAGVEKPLHRQAAGGQPPGQLLPGGVVLFDVPLLE